MEIIANLQYKVIDAKKTYEVRHPVLRKNLPLSTCYMELDDDVSTIHLGGFIKKKMVAVLSILINPKYSNYQTPNAQVRGMAVLNKYQSKGIGINMFTEAEKKINKHHATCPPNHDNCISGLITNSILLTFHSKGSV